MSEAKQVANTLLTILDNSIVKQIQDRSSWFSEEVIKYVLDFWNYDLLTKKPGIAYTDDELKYTTLDLATFLMALVDRNAVIVLPEYERMRPKTIKDTQISLSSTNRMGQCLNLISNQTVFNFGVRIKDVTVIDTKKDGSQVPGSFRTFLMTGMDGSLYDGWKKIDFVPNAKENNFLNNKDLWDINNIRFDYFVNPEKWISFYGQYYFIAKVLIDRLAEERNQVSKLKQNILNSGIKYPSKPDEWFGDEIKNPDTKKEKKYDTVKVMTFEAEVDLPRNDSKFPEVNHDSTNLSKLYYQEKRLNKYLERLRFLTRSIELAFANKHSLDNSNEGKFIYPSWIKNFGWEYDFRLPGKRSKWFRLKIVQPAVGALSVALRYRWAEKSQKVKHE